MIPRLCMCYFRHSLFLFIIPGKEVRMKRAVLSLLCCLLAFVSTLRAGLYSSYERYAELPASWKGFLADQRLLRAVALPPSDQTPPSVLKQDFSAAAERLQNKRKKSELTTDE